MWGDARLAEVASALPRAIAAATFGSEYRPLQWYPVAYLDAWHEAIHAGPCAGDDAVFAQCMDRALDVSVGRLRRAFMRLMNPVTLARRSSELWSSFHSHGKMEVAWSNATSARVTLVDHPFVSTRLGRLTFSEMVRYTLALSRAQGVRQEHALERGGRLTVVLTWEG